VNQVRRFGFASAAGMLLCAILTSVAMGAPGVLDSIPTLDTLINRLELTPDQVAKLQPIFSNRVSELQQSQLELQAAATRQQKRDVLRHAKEAGNAFNSQVESLLTPTQKTEWREIRTEVREKAKERIEEKRSSE
jgi:hypothetical protein